MNAGTLTRFAWLELRRQVRRTLLLTIPAFLVGCSMSVFIYSRIKPGVLAFPGAATLSFIFVLATTAGIVSSDVKSGWLRGILSRPMTRASVLWMRLLTTTTLVAAMLAVCWLLMIAAQTIRGGVPSLEGQIPGDLALRILLVMGLVVTYAVLSIILSCFVPGNGNSIVLLIWSTGALVAQYSVSRIDAPEWVRTLADSAFPSGLYHALGDVHALSWGSPELAWGVFSLFLFLALAFWAMNSIVADREDA